MFSLPMPSLKAEIARGTFVATCARRTHLRGCCLDVDVLVSGPEFILDRARDYLPPRWTRTHALRPRVRYSFRNVAEPANSSAGPLIEFESELQHRIAVASTEYVFVHAGVVVWNGLGILIPGQTYSGKSTLVAALVEAGATYCSDEYAVLDRRGFVHPWPRPVRLRTGRGIVRLLPERVQTIPVRAGLVVACCFETGARWSPASLSCGQGMLKLLEHAVPIRSRPETVLPYLRAAVDAARVIETKRGEAGPTAAALLETLPKWMES